MQKNSNNMVIVAIALVPVIAIGIFLYYNSVSDSETTPDQISPTPTSEKNQAKNTPSKTDKDSSKPAYDVEDLASDIMSHSPYNREKALKRIETEKKFSVDSLERSLKDMKTAGNAAIVLSELGEKAKGSISKIEYALKQAGDEGQRTIEIWLNYSLAKLKKSEDSVTAISKFLKDEDFALRHQSLQALGRLGKISQKYLPEMKKLTTDENEKVRLAAEWACSQLGIETLLSKVPEKIDEKPASYWLGELKSLDREKRNLAIEKLLDLGSSADSVIAQGLSDSALVETICEELIYKLGPKVKTVEPALRNLRVMSSSGKDYQVEMLVCFGFVMIDVEKESNIERIVEIMKDNDDYHKQVGLRLLGKIGSGASGCAEYINELKLSDSDQIRVAAKKALEQIKGAEELFEREIDGKNLGVWLDAFRNIQNYNTVIEIANQLMEEDVPFLVKSLDNNDLFMGASLLLGLMENVPEGYVADIKTSLSKSRLDSDVMKELYLSYTLLKLTKDQKYIEIIKNNLSQDGMQYFALILSYYLGEDSKSLHEKIRKISTTDQTIIDLQNMILN